MTPLLWILLLAIAALGISFIVWDSLSIRRALRRHIATCPQCHHRAPMEKFVDSTSKSLDPGKDLVVLVCPRCGHSETV